MAAPEEQAPAPKFIFLGDTEEERISSAQWFQIGAGIMQRYGQNFTPDEKMFMNIAFAQFAKPQVEEKGVKPVARPQQQGQNEPQPTGSHPAGNKPQKR